MSFIIVSKTNGVRALFTWIPKTGGTSLYHALRDHPETDVWIIGQNRSQHDLPPENHGCDFHFLAVRHPVSWWESCFRFWKSVGWRNFEPDRWVPGRPLLECQSDEFPEFMANVARREPGFCSRMYEWYLGPPGRSDDALVLRQEALSEGYALVCARLGIKGVLPTLNVSPGPRAGWPPDLLLEVRRLEGPAIRRFYREDAYE